MECPSSHSCAWSPMLNLCLVIPPPLCGPRPAVHAPSLHIAPQGSTPPPLALSASVALAALPPQSLFLAVGGVQVQLLACGTCSPGPSGCILHPDGAHVVGVVTRATRAVDAAVECQWGLGEGGTPTLSPASPSVVRGSARVCERSLLFMLQGACP